MRHSPHLADFLFGERSTRRAVLEALFSEPATRIHLRELARMTGFSPTMVAKELRGLVERNVVVEGRDGNTRVFQANMRSPLAQDIQRIAAHPRTRRSGTHRESTDVAAAGRRRPRSLREAAEWGGALGRRDALLREFYDEFYRASARRRAAMVAEEPPASDDDRANAYYAAVAEHLALSYGFAVPSWALAESRFLRKPFFPAGLESLKSTVLVESPPAFRRRMIFVGADPLFRPRRSSAPPAARRRA
jgi:hypothetical protein